MIVTTNKYVFMLERFLKIPLYVTGDKRVNIDHVPPATAKNIHRNSNDKSRPLSSVFQFHCSKTIIINGRLPELTIDVVKVNRCMIKMFD